jgi:hypothetical protein
VKPRHRMIAACIGLLLALTFSVTTAAGRGGLDLRGSAFDLSAAVPAQQGTCTTMQAESDAEWLATDESGEATDEVVESYPTGTTVIAAQFAYNCLPKNAVIVTVFALDGEVIFSNKAPQKPKSKSGIYAYTLSREDGEPMPDGEWEVGFFNNKTLLTSSTITVGGDEPAPTGDAISVQGTVKDTKTKKPIKGALVIVLNEGVTAEAFIDDPQDADVYTAATTNARGEFVLESTIERDVPHSWIIAAKGYKPIIEDEYVIGGEAEDPLELNITLSK